MKFRCDRVQDGQQCRLSKEHIGKTDCQFQDSPANSTPIEAHRERKTRKVKTSQYRTKAEARYADYLEGLRRAGEIERWEYELFSLLVGVDCRWRIDFYVVVKRHDFLDVTRLEIQIHEVKGPHRFREKGIVKLRAAAKQYPEFKFFLAKIDRGQWDIQEIKP